MSRDDEHQGLAAEAHFLMSQIQALPREATLTRSSLEARLRVALVNLANVPSVAFSRTYTVMSLSIKTPKAE